MGSNFSIKFDSSDIPAKTLFCLLINMSAKETMDEINNHLGGITTYYPGPADSTVVLSYVRTTELRNQLLY